MCMMVSIIHGMHIPCALLWGMPTTMNMIHINNWLSKNDDIRTLHHIMIVPVPAPTL